MSVKENLMLMVGPAPHIKTKQDVSIIMRWVIIAMIPSVVMAVYHFGLRALLVILVAVASSVLAEYGICKCKPFGFKMRISDGSAVITGMLLAFNLPSNIPLWMVVVGSAVAIIFGKMVFGGLGYNPVNPALAGRAFLTVSWPVSMTASWVEPIRTTFGLSGVTLPQATDAVTAATPLTMYKYSEVSTEILRSTLFNSFIGNIGGCLGETSAAAILVGGLILLYKKIISWRIPFIYIATVFVLSWAFQRYSHPFSVDAWVEPLFAILTGGLFLGAFFMATDMVTSPVTKKGQIIFALCLGLLTWVIRRWGGFPEGVTYSIVLMNLTVGFINKHTRPRVFGKAKR